MGGNRKPYTGFGSQENQSGLPLGPLIGQTWVIKSQMLIFFAFISFIIAFRAFECFWEAERNHIQGVWTASQIYPLAPLMSQTGVIKSQILFVAFISFIIAFRAFEYFWEVVRNLIQGVWKSSQVYSLAPLWVKLGSQSHRCAFWLTTNNS